MRHVFKGALATAALTALVFGGMTPAAAQVAGPQAAIALKGAAGGDLTENVQYRRGWHGHRHYRGGRYGHRHGHRYYRRGYGPGVVGGLAAGAIIGGALAAQSAAAANNAHAYCASRFRSYDPASGTYMGYDGIRRACP